MMSFMSEKMIDASISVSFFSVL